MESNPMMESSRPDLRRFCQSMVGRFGGILIVAGAVVLLDRLTKAWVLEHMAIGESRRVLSFFYLTHVHNTGTAFGLLQGNNRFLLIVAFLILGGLLYSARGLCERGGLWGFWGVSLVLGGAIGNMIDRYRFGKVVDFLDFRVWPVFNFADSAISVGAVLLLVGLLRYGDET
jgi:signal peptidase II